MIKYVETKYTDKKLMLSLLRANIKSVDMMAANMLNPHTEYPVFKELMKKLINGYR